MKVRVPIEWDNYSYEQQTVIKEIFNHDGIDYCDDSYTVDIEYAINMGEWCNPNYPPNIMHYAKYCQIQGVSIRELTAVTSDLSILMLVNKFISSGVEESDMINYINNKFYIFTRSQLEQIFMGILSGVDINTYAKEDYSCEEMKEIRRNLEEGLGKVHAEELLNY
jgi:hypothetical protein